VNRKTLAIIVLGNVAAPPEDFSRKKFDWPMTLHLFSAAHA
jgi:hypothetical protein